MGKNKKVKNMNTENEVAQPFDEPEKPIFHMLNSGWVWYYREVVGRNSSVNWNEAMKAVSSFDSIENFWSLFNHLEMPSALRGGSDYYLFKTPIKPAWEDPANANGGRWAISLQKCNRQIMLDTLWLNLILAMIGGQFGKNDHLICGAVAGVRNAGDRLHLWIAQCSKEAIEEIGQVLRKTVFPDVVNPPNLQYKGH